MPLDQYRRKRRFGVTPEPRGKLSAYDFDTDASSQPSSQTLPLCSSDNEERRQKAAFACPGDV